MGFATAARRRAADLRRRSASRRRSCWSPAALLQGLALGGEYGGAAIYVAEHAPPNKRGLYTSFIQASVIGGFILSVVVVLASNALVSAEARDDWALAHPLPVLAAAARGLPVGAAEAQGEPGLPGDEGGGPDGAQPAAGELRQPPPGEDDPGRLVRHRRRAHRDLVHGAVPGALLPSERAPDRRYRGAADDRHRGDVQHVLVHLVRLAVRQDRPQGADRHRLCPDHRPHVPPVPLDGVGGQSGAGDGDASATR